VDIAQNRRFEQSVRDVSRLDEELKQIFAAYADLLTQVCELRARIETLEARNGNRSRRTAGGD
jgi:hypothetical protein